MRLTISELLHGKSGFSIWGKHKQPQQCRGGEIGQRLDRNSVDLHKTRLQTRRCSLENCGMAAHSPQAVEELHCVVPRQDSITLAKRRLSHDVQAAGDSPTRATAAAGVNSTWNISSQQAAALTA